MISCHSIKFFGTVLVVQLVGEVKTGDKILIGDDDNIPKTINKIVLFMILSAAGLCFSVYLFYVSYPLSVQSWLLAVGFTLLSVIAGSFNIYAAMWYYRSYQYDGYLKNIMSKLKPVTSYPTVAVLIPSYNEEPDMVERNIKSLFALNYPQ